MTDTHTDYLLQLFYSQIERDHCTRAASLLKLLSLHLPASEIDGLHEQIGKSLNPVQIREREIRRFVKNRRIKHLVHFTQAKNVCSIFEYGLIPRQALHKQLGKRAHSVCVNDPYRYDNHLDANCLSISFPNYRMFYRYQKAKPFNHWAVLLIRAEVLWKMDCAFYKTNASANCTRSATLDELKTAEALAALFDDYEDGTFEVARSSLRIPRNCPTNPQAEVLVFGLIPVEDISAVCVRARDESFAMYRDLWKGVPVRSNPNFFGPRRDHAHWKK